MLARIKVFFINLKCFLVSKKHRVSTFGDIFKVSDECDLIYIARLNRHNRYKRGIFYGVNLLAEEYSLDKISNTDNGILIDCGANIGELGFWAKKQNLHYIGFEPECNEFKCLSINAGEKNRVENIALWNKNEKLKFNSLPNSGDSSVFDIHESITSFEVDGRRLDTVIESIDINGPRILKVEAEGAEPEVLEGAKQILKYIDFITVDCGPERGINQEYTFIAVNNFMLENNFSLVVAKFERVTMLYKNNLRDTEKYLNIDNC